MAWTSANIATGWNFSAPYTIQNLSSNVFIVSNSNVVTTTYNIVDDGHGKITYNGNLSCSANGGVYFDNNGNAIFKPTATNANYWGVASSGGSVSSPSFYVYNNTSGAESKVATGNNVVLDDGSGNMLYPYPTVNAQPCRVQIGNNSDFYNGTDHFALGVAVPSGAGVWPFGVMTGGTRRFYVDNNGVVGTQYNLLDSSTGGDMAYYNTLQCSQNNAGLFWDQNFNGQFGAGATNTSYIWRINDNTNTINLLNLVNQTGSVSIKGSFNPGSDRKLKTNIRPLTISATEKIMPLQPVTFQWKVEVENNTSTATLIHGFIAQDVQLIFPELVKESKEKKDGDDTFLTLSYIEFLPILTKAIQELHADDNDMQKQIDELESDIAALLSQVKEIKEACLKGY